MWRAAVIIAAAAVLTLLAAGLWAIGIVEYFALLVPGLLAATKGIATVSLAAIKRALTSGVVKRALRTVLHVLLISPALHRRYKRLMVHVRRPSRLLAARLRALAGRLPRWLQPIAWAAAALVMLTLGIAVVGIWIVAVPLPKVLTAPISYLARQLLHFIWSSITSIGLDKSLLHTWNRLPVALRENFSRHRWFIRARRARRRLLEP